MVELGLRHDPQAPLKLLCVGAHSDDIEIGCGATILRLKQMYSELSVCWVVLSCDQEDRKSEALAGATALLEGVRERNIVVESFRESYFPFTGERIKTCLEQIKSRFDPDLVLTHYRFDLHQDHKTVSELTWQTFRHKLILEYEIPKWDGDLGVPNLYVPVTDDLAEQKIRVICETFRSQAGKGWLTPDTFHGLMRLRGIEAGTTLAEAFYARKLVLWGNHR